MKNKNPQASATNKSIRFEVSERGRWLNTLKLPGSGHCTTTCHINVVSREKCPPSVIDLIRKRYRQAFSADIEVAYPEIAYVTDAAHNALAALGLRSAATEPLFLEQYLDSPIQDTLNVSRVKITEIGNLVSSRRDVTPGLFITAALLLNRRGTEYAVATGNQLLEKRLRMLGMKPERLAPATMERLAECHENWGDYYQKQPQVLCGSVGNAARYLYRFAGISLQRSATAQTDRHKEHVDRHKEHAGDQQMQFDKNTNAVLPQSNLQDSAHVTSFTPY